MLMRWRAHSSQAKTIYSTPCCHYNVITYHGIRIYTYVGTLYVFHFLTKLRTVNAVRQVKVKGKGPYTYLLSMIRTYYVDFSARRREESAGSPSFLNRFRQNGGILEISKLYSLSKERQICGGILSTAFECKSESLLPETVGSLSRKACRSVLYDDHSTFFHRESPPPTHFAFTP